MLDTLIKGGYIVDGTGAPGYRAHVGVKDGRVAGIYRGESVPEADMVIDAARMVLCPGFIDVHTHTDYTIYHHHQAKSSLGMGVTTEVMGMCGHTVFPVTMMTIPQIKQAVARFSGIDIDDVMDLSWEGLSGWLEVLDRHGVGINVAQMAGHGMLRTVAMGRENKGGDTIEPSRAQMEEMRSLLSQAMDEGAFGLASGLGYPPGRNATTAELISLGEVVGEKGGAYITHLRNEGEHLAFSVAEMVEIARQTGVRASATHHKALGFESWGKIRNTLALIEDARTLGVQVMADFYPWTYAAQSNLGTIFSGSPVSVEKDEKTLLQRLALDSGFKEIRDSVEKALNETREGAERRARGLAAFGIPISLDVWSPETQYLVHSRCCPGLVGMNIDEICRSQGRGSDLDSVLSVMREIYLQDEGETYIAGGKMDPVDTDMLASHPLVAFSTDGWTLSAPVDMKQPGLHVHPRQYGTYPLVLEWFVRERKIISLEEAIRKMTSLPASLLGIDDRGLIRDGMWADLVVFDPQQVANRATHSGPQSPPVGIEWVLVNGGVAVENGLPTSGLHGQVLRRK